MNLSVKDREPYNFYIYLGTFIIAFSTLALEISLSRLLSVMMWYHLAFFAVSTAMLGMTAGATTVYLKPNWFTQDNLRINLAKVCFGYSVSVPVSLILLCLIQVNIGSSNMKFFALLFITFLCALPFYFSGIAVTAVLTKYKLPIGKLYASDLLGAALGCLFVLGGLEIFDAPGLIILCGAVGILSVYAFAYKLQDFRWRKLSAIIFILLLAGVSFNLISMNGIRPVYVKGASEEPSQFIYEKWNSFSRVVVFDSAKGNPNWFSSPIADQDSSTSFYWMLIDGDAGTALLKHKNNEKLSILRYDITNIAYYLKEGAESACIMGFGGGKDIHSALTFGIKNVVGVDVNPVFIDLQKNKFRKESGLADLPNVSLVVDEARSYLSRSDQKFSVIQMSLIDTWASTGAGAFTLTENSLYTLEAWKIFLEHLDENGVFTVSRWYSPNNLGETGRIVSLAVTSLLHSGIKEPSRHIAMMSIGRMATIIVSKKPFSDNDIITLKSVSKDLKYNPDIIPGEKPVNKILSEIVSVKSDEELTAIIKDEPLNYRPPTDNDPYFFNMLRLSHLGEINTSENGVLYGNLTATITLLALIFSLLVLTAVTVIFPLTFNRTARKEKNIKIFWKGAVYFSLIGAGFMMVEIGLIQRLSVFLGHPVYGLGILLFTIILSAGMGSFFSEKLHISSGKLKYILPVAAAILIILVKFILDMVMPAMTASSEISKIIISILVIFPLGFILGTFFPTGMKLVKPVSDAETPWFWALNGIFGVLFSALAVFFSIYTGISTNFYLAAFFYAAIILLIKSISKNTGQIS